ncbi:hypothetical protein LOC71_01720 [Rhodopirellula sp. JC740]|uniref:LTXXQ motif protein n=1 Tax=Rhodopirellula halodulae TaxID=2894198 RepID=A0ABS8NC34_9BACT|nr:hypothetical protein [Rhodopirellula sp. JC740]MCC9640974.1 hypothetical protein [Rhodopirellula sp. JC740]
MKPLFSLALVVCFACPVLADDEAATKKKRAGNRQAGGWMARNVEKSLEAVELTDEQKEKLADAKKQFTSELKELREAGLTQELMKKRMEAQKAARESGLKGKELAAKLKEDFSEDEQALFAKQQKAVAAMRKSVAGMLTPEQMEKLPEQARKQFTAAKQRGEGKGKKNGKGKKKTQEA